MKIEHLLEFVDEDFKSMSQKATNIAGGKGAVDNTQLRQQRITQLAANQKTRNAAPAGKPMAPAGQQPTAPIPQQQAVQQAPQQQAVPDQVAAPQQQGQPAGKSIGQRIGGIAGGVGSLVGGVAGIGRAIKKGYQKGATTVGGPKAAAGGLAAGNQDFSQLEKRISALEKAVGISESYKFHSKYLGIDI